MVFKCLSFYKVFKIFNSLTKLQILTTLNVTSGYEMYYVSQVDIETLDCL